MPCCRALLRVMLCVPLAMFFSVTGQRAALSQDGGQEGGATAFDGADTNSDGAVTIEEWDGSSARIFDAVDTDKDGQGRAEELSQAFETFDYNHDGVIDGRESPIIITMGDTDGDGLVGPEEFKSIDWTRETIDSDGDGAVSRREFRDARRGIYTHADRDRDRSLSLQEFDDAARITLFRF